MAVNRDELMQCLNDPGRVDRVLEEADGGDACSTGCQAGFSIFERDSADS